MTDSKTYTIAGTSTLNGATTFRFATGKATVRAGVLKRGGHTDIALQDLPSAMTKEDAIKFLEKGGITAVLPKSGRKAAITKTPEEIAAEAEEAKRAARNEARKLARANAKQKTATESDAAFVEGSPEALINAPPAAEQIDDEDAPVESLESPVHEDAEAAA